MFMFADTIIFWYIPSQTGILNCLKSFFFIYLFFRTAQNCALGSNDFKCDEKKGCMKRLTKRG